MTTRKRRATMRAAFVLLALLPAEVRAQHGATAPTGPMREYTTAPITASEATAWRADLAALAEFVRTGHGEFDWRTPAARFDAAVTALHDSIPTLPAHRIVVGFARLHAMIGDGHTSLPLWFAQGVDFHILPYRLGVYEEGVFVEAADRSLERIVGARVTAIGGVPIAQAIARVAPLVSRDNDNFIAVVAPHLLNRIEVLHAVGLARALDDAELTVEIEGREVRQTVRPLAERRAQAYGVPFLAQYTHDWVDARDGVADSVPLHQRDFDQVYGWRYLPEQDLLYIKLDQVQNRDDGPSAFAVFREALAFAREHTPARTVIDVRNNTGGEGGILPPIMREIVRTHEVDEPGRLFVVIGKRTFSAAQWMTAWLEAFTTATIVGEPSSARYNGYAGHVSATLPHSGIGVNASPDYYQMSWIPDDERQQATPRLAAVPTFADYRAGRDAALEAIVAWSPGALTRAVESAVAAGDTARALAAVRAEMAHPRNRFGAALAPELNALGYRLLRDGRADDAIAVFQVNVRAHPRYANGFDSLGEALAGANRREEAIAAFRRALEIQPDFRSPRDWLHRLGASAR